MSAARTVAYLYGGGESGLRQGVMAMHGDGRVEYVAHTAEEVVDVAEGVGDAVYVATAHAIYRLEIPGSIRLVLRTPPEVVLESIAPSTRGDVIYFSTADEIFALEGLIAVAVTRNLGGTLRLWGDSVFVCDSKRRLVARLTPQGRARVEFAALPKAGADDAHRGLESLPIDCIKPSVDADVFDATSHKLLGRLVDIVRRGTAEQCAYIFQGSDGVWRSKEQTEILLRRAAGS